MESGRRPGLPCPRPGQTDHLHRNRRHRSSGDSVSILRKSRDPRRENAVSSRFVSDGRITIIPQFQELGLARWSPHSRKYVHPGDRQTVTHRGDDLPSVPSPTNFHETNFLNFSSESAKSGQGPQSRLHPIFMASQLHSLTDLAELLEIIIEYCLRLIIQVGSGQLTHSGEQYKFQCRTNSFNHSSFERQFAYSRRAPCSYPAAPAKPAPSGISATTPRSSKSLTSPAPSVPSEEPRRDTSSGGITI